MKRVLLTGGGTGGHIYPLISVGKNIKKIAKGDIKVEYIGPKSKYIQEIEDNNIRTYKITSAKMRRYFDVQNLIDIPKFIYSIFEALVKLYFIMPDVVFSKGGPGSIPVVIAAKFYMIPIVVHESDSIPSLTTKITSKLAKKVGISFEVTNKYLSSSKTFLAGNPVRDIFLNQDTLNKNQAKAYLNFDKNEPLILVMGGSQGSTRINSLILNNLDALVSNFQIYHIVGQKNVKEVKSTTDIIFKRWEREKRNKYKYTGYIEAKEMAIALTAADLVISRSGSGTIFESAIMRTPAMLVPLEGSANNHQKVNAYEYSKAGAAIVIEENNFSASIASARAQKILGNPQRLQKMQQAAKNFAKPDAANKIAREIFNIIL